MNFQKMPCRHAREPDSIVTRPDLGVSDVGGKSGGGGGGGFSLSGGFITGGGIITLEGLTGYGGLVGKDGSFGTTGTGGILVYGGFAGGGDGGVPRGGLPDGRLPLEGLGCVATTYPAEDDLAVGTLPNGRDWLLCFADGDCGLMPTDADMGTTRYPV